MIAVLLVMAVGMILGFLLKKKKGFLKFSEKMTTASIFTLLFMLGIGVGLNEKIIQGLDTIGWQALIITFGAVSGSLVFAYITYQLFFRIDYEK